MRMIILLIGLLVSSAGKAQDVARIKAVDLTVENISRLLKEDRLKSFEEKITDMVCEEEQITTTRYFFAGDQLKLVIQTINNEPEHRYFFDRNKLVFISVTGSNPVDIYVQAKKGYTSTGDKTYKRIDIETYLESAATLLSNFRFTKMLLR